METVRRKSRFWRWLSDKPTPSSTFCAFDIRSRVWGEPFRPRKICHGRLSRSHEVSENGPCEIPTRGLVCPTASARSRSIAALLVALLSRRHRHRSDQLSLPDGAKSSLAESAASATKRKRSPIAPPSVCLPGGGWHRGVAELRLVANALVRSESSKSRKRSSDRCSAIRRQDTESASSSRRSTRKEQGSRDRSLRLRVRPIGCCQCHAFSGHAVGMTGSRHEQKRGRLRASAIVAARSSGRPRTGRVLRRQWRRGSRPACGRKESSWPMRRVHLSDGSRFEDVKAGLRGVSRRRRPWRMIRKAIAFQPSGSQAPEESDRGEVLGGAEHDRSIGLSNGRMRWHGGNCERWALGPPTGSSPQVPRRPSTP